MQWEVRCDWWFCFLFFFFSSQLGQIFMFWSCSKLISFVTGLGVCRVARSDCWKSDWFVSGCGCKNGFMVLFWCFRNSLEECHWLRDHFPQVVWMQPLSGEHSGKDITHPQHPTSRMCWDVGLLWGRGIQHLGGFLASFWPSWTFGRRCDGWQWWSSSVLVCTCLQASSWAWHPPAAQLASSFIALIGSWHPKAPGSGWECSRKALGNATRNSHGCL